MQAFFLLSDKEIVAPDFDNAWARIDAIAPGIRFALLNPDVQVILSSGYNEQEATSRFTGMGLAEFIQKPYHTDALRQVMRTAMQRETR
jgi:DNA-binding NtrC family response regulator